MDKLARLSAADRAAVFRAAAAEQGLPPPYIEKDFWVCWSLRRLFDPPLVNGMVFKGGTSLSKVWQAIHRFSEDIDVTLPRDGIPGAGQIETNDAQSVSSRKKIKTELGKLLTGWCEGPGLREVAARITAGLDTARGWTIKAEEDSLEFTYPIALPAGEYGGGYVKRLVRLEFGLTMPTFPFEHLTVRPYSSRAGQYRMEDPEVHVCVLAPERTFWEKVTLIHAENSRPVPTPADRVSRHYADVAALFSHEIGGRALTQMELLPRVAREKERYFYTAWARYEDAARGQLRLLPPPEHERALRRDYLQMRDMYYKDPLPFDAILGRLKELQQKVASHALFRAIRD